jgi:hypothetical protein
MTTVTTMDETTDPLQHSFQAASSLEDLVTFEVEPEVFGLARSPAAIGFEFIENPVFTQMMIPIYNGASKDGASCTEDLNEAGEGLGTFAPSGTILGSTLGVAADEAVLVGLFEKADLSVTTIGVESEGDVFLGCAIMIPATSDCCTPFWT